jgi:hypothetical protein
MKLSRQIIIVSVLVLVLVFGFSGLSQVVADVGPVRVEFNATGERLGPSRANTATAFRIYFRINQNIEVHDWVKIWFPINEASNDPADICGDPLVIKGFDESQRFVPNKKYFKKYDNPDEREIGKLYEVLDEHDVNTEFFDCESCEETKDNCRIIQDPSGLGCWIMGTALPPIPKDESDRKNFLRLIDHFVVMGYRPCGGSYVMMTQTYKESSLQFNSQVGIEAWRQGYNPIDVRISVGARFITPATPGRYRLKIATRGEPTPIESESFVLPCSEITEFTVTCNSDIKSKQSEYTFDFFTGEGGTLDANTSLITIKFPDEFMIPEIINPAYIMMNGVQFRIKPQIFTDTNKIILVSPLDINSFERINIVFAEGVKINCPTKSETLKFEISTSSEPVFIESKYFTIEYNLKESLIRNFTLDSNKCGDVFSGDFSLDARNLRISTNTNFEFIFPPGVKIPNRIVPGQFLINGCSPANLQRLSSGRLSFKLSKNANFGEYQLRSIKFKISKYAKILNPKIPGVYRFGIIIDKQKMIWSTPLRFQE